MKTELVRYVKDECDNKLGVVVAVKRDDNTFGIGWSKCAFSKGDHFNRKLALTIARGRAKTGTNKMVPDCVKPTLENVQLQAAEYFQISV